MTQDKTVDFRTGYSVADKVKVDKLESTLILADGLTVDVDMANFSNFALITTQNFTLNNPTGETIGQVGFIDIIHTGITGQITLGTAYQTAGGAGISLTIVDGAKDVLKYTVLAQGTIFLELFADIK